MRHGANNHSSFHYIIPVLTLAWILVADASLAASVAESGLQQQFLHRAEQSMAIELQGQLLSHEMQRLKKELAESKRAAAEDRAMCGEIDCFGSEAAATALRKYLQSLQALLSSTQALRQHAHQTAGIMVKTEGLLLESEGGLHRQEMAIAVSSALIDFNQIVTGNIGTLMKRLDVALNDDVAAAGSIGQRSGSSVLSEHNENIKAIKRGEPAKNKLDFRKAVAMVISQTLQESINATLAKGIKEPGLAASLTNEVLNQATDAITSKLYNAYVAKPGYKIELSSTTIGLGIVRAGLEGIAKEKLRERENQAAGMRRQLSDNERNRMFWIMQWRLAQRLYKNLQASEKEASALLAEFEQLAQVCKFKSRQLKACRMEAGGSLQAAADKHRARIDAATKKLEEVSRQQQAKLKPLAELRQKIAANEQKAEQWKRKYAEARESGSAMADSYRESMDMAKQAAADDRLALRSHEMAIDSEFRWPLDQARLELQQAIENGQMAMEFAQNDAMKKVRACLFSDAGPTSSASKGRKADEKDKLVLDELLDYSVKAQHDALTALQAVKISYNNEKCDKQEPPASAAEAALPAIDTPGVAIDPAFAGLYNAGDMLVRLSVDGSRIRGEVVEVCERQEVSGFNYQPGDFYLEGRGSSARGIDGRLRLKRQSRITTPEGSRPLQCKWEKPQDQWVEAELYRVPDRHPELFVIGAKFTMPLSLIECGTAERPWELHFTRRLEPVTGIASIENSFRRECAGFTSRQSADDFKLKMGRPPEMPALPIMEQPLLEPEPLPLLLPEPPQ